MTIVTTNYRYQRPPGKRKEVALDVSEGRDGPVRGLGGMTTRLTRADGALPSKQPNKHRQDEALWLAYRLNAALVSLVERRALRWNVTLALAVIVLGLFAMAGLMIWAAWR